MTTQETKSDGPAVLSSVELERVDKFDHPDHGWMWRDCEMRWIDARVAAAVRAERMACAKLCREIAVLKLDSFYGPGCCSQVADKCNVAILARSNAAISGAKHPID